MVVAMLRAVAVAVTTAVGVAVAMMVDWWWRCQKGPVAVAVEWR